MNPPRRPFAIWERFEDQHRQRRYGILFTLFVHGGLFIMLIAQVNWQLKKPTETSIGITYAELLPPQTAATPNLETAIKPQPTLVDMQGLALPSQKPLAKISPPKAAPKPAANPTAKVLPKNAPVETAKNTPTKKTEATKEDKKNFDPLSSIIERSTEIETPINSAKPATPNPAATSHSFATALAGTGSGPHPASEDSQAIAHYVDQIKSAIRLKINYPEGISSNPQVELLIKQDSDGTIRWVKISKSSNILAFDEAIVRAVYSASPLPLPNQPQYFSPDLKIVWKRFE